MKSCSKLCHCKEIFSRLLKKREGLRVRLGIQGLREAGQMTKGICSCLRCFWQWAEWNGGGISNTLPLIWDSQKGNLKLSDYSMHDAACLKGLKHSHSLVLRDPNVLRVWRPRPPSTSSHINQSGTVQVKTWKKGKHISFNCNIQINGFCSTRIKH